ncbi:MAG TPA: uroporphyrinogen decarboxylase family protein [Clostridia bacterium]|nr:uroporphyrinogen decarboxylase family protein [Clostridia bacterium]
MMGNRERVLAALRFESGAGVPYEIGFNKGALEKMVRRTGDRDFARHTGSHLGIVSLSAPETQFRPGFFRDEYGVVWNRSGADRDVGNIEGNVVGSLEELENYRPPAVDRAWVLSRAKALSELDDGNFHVAQLHFSVFERAWSLCGMENLLIWMLDEPEAVRGFLDKITSRCLEVLETSFTYPYDCVYTGDDWGQQRGLIMGPPLWREFIKPCFERIYGLCHAHGRFTAHHSCGDLRDILMELPDMGLDIYQTFQPEIYGLETAALLRGKLSVWGGISTQRDLPFLSPEDIRALVKRTAAAFPEGGLILAPTHSVMDDVPEDNILALLAAFREQAGAEA